jgi:gamma-glutamyl hydrolase
MCIFISIVFLLFNLYAAQKEVVIGVYLKNATEELNLTQYTYSVDSQYIRFLTQAGAKVVPIKYNDPLSEIDKLLSKLNGILFTGGATFIRNEDYTLTKYGEVGKYIYGKILQFNANGIFYPLWGTCLGFELIAIAAQDTHILSKCPNCTYYSTSVKLGTSIKNSKILSYLSLNSLYAMQYQDITFNNHQWALLPNNLSSDYTLVGTSLSHDNSLEFISIFENKKLPIYGVQFHPEMGNMKATYNYRSAVHNVSAILLSQELANFFYSECLQNSNHMAIDDYNALSIYNYPTIFTSKYQNYIIN